MEQIKVKTLYLGERINLKQIGEKPLVLSPLIINCKKGHAVILKYGVIVLFGIDDNEEKDFINKILNSVDISHNQFTEEETFIIINNDKDDFINEKGEIILKRKPSLIKMQLIAIVLAENIVLSWFEQNIEEIFDKLEPLMVSLKNTGINSAGTEEKLLNSISLLLKAMLKTIGKVKISDNPDILWDNPEHEKFFKSLKDEYEILERDTFLNKKFQTASEIIETFLDLTRHYHSVRLDWYIILLIGIAVSIMLYELIKPFIFEH